MKIAIWSGPRNLSTALMYAFAARGDCDVWDEPFYAAYLRATGIDHPMREQIIASHENDPAKVAALLDAPTERHFYGKQMTMHMLPDFPRDWMFQHTNVFLIRHPARVIASYAAKREAPTLEDLGFRQQAELFDQVADHLGHVPPVIDSETIRADPIAALTALCEAIGLPFTRKMLTWPKGPKPYDGIWAAHWYPAVHQSTTFAPPEDQLPALEGENVRLSEAAWTYYDRLKAHEL
jgi:hypothetical protein